MTLRITLLLSMVLLNSCTSVDWEAPGTVDVSDELKSSPRYAQAKRFDALVQGRMGADELKAWNKECQTSKDVFCYTVAREKNLRSFLVRTENKTTALWEKPEPIIPVFAKGRVQNWSTIQKANLKGLLAGMRVFSAAELRSIGKFALARPECPNNVAIASAALLEVFLASENVAEEIAKLYEKGARCTRRGSANQEHYLTRASLFWIYLKQYAKAEKLLSKIVPADAFSGRAAYWLYRVRTQLGRKDAAKTALQKLKNLHPLSFHTLMLHAQEKTDPLGSAIEPLPHRSQKRPGSNVLIEQAETLKEMGFIDSAAKITSWAFLVAPPLEAGVRAYLASLGDAPTQIRVLQGVLLGKSALRTRPYYELAYPKAYFPIFESNSSDPYLLAAIARKESHLDPRAVSPANAQGLLQLNPETAKRLSGQETPDLFNPKVNTALASRYLSELRSQMRGQLALMIAAYNAGEQSVATWTQRYPTSDPLLFVDLIPYRETRDYVGFVMANYYWYRRLYGDNPQAALISLSGEEIARVEQPREIRSIPVASEEAKPSPLPGEEAAPGTEATSPDETL
ncbi:lytic transglycosylase domain-containing protein [bacterium]|nr:lytic transglycosylase domain-containing protein [bacterium]